MSIMESILRQDYCSFLAKAFYTLNPSVRYLHNWHIDKIVEALEKLERGESRRLIINMPPRYLKSLCVSVAWPAFLLGRNPARRIITASYSNSLSVKHSLDTRNIMQTNWYKKVFPKCEFAADQNEKSKFMTSKNGFRMATSVNGSIIGEGGNFLIIDDPLSPEKAMCKTSREQVVRWFDQSFSTRLDDKKNGVIILVMQRLHKEDLAGVLLQRGGWEHLCLPVANDNDELLHEAREGWDEINQIKNDMGQYAFMAQYMQQPVSISGGIIKKKWLKFYDEKIEPIAIYQSWDTAIKTNDQADYTVCLTLAEAQNGFYLIDALRGKFGYPDLKRQVMRMNEKWNPNAILVEDKASGQSLIQDLQREGNLPVIAQMPKYDKLTRLAAASPIIEAGRLYLQKNNEMAAVLEAELLDFPNGHNDDIVDALSQFLNWVKNKNYNLPGIRRI